jgi:transcriptional regulator with XRE-family HTH domain
MKARKLRAKFTFDWAASGRRLRVTRLALGISEKDAASAYGVTLQTYRKYENGAPERGSAFVDFAEKYDVSIDWLICGTSARLGSHLTKNRGGKIAILPVINANERQRRDRALVAFSCA